jgi:hypothetical protein
MEIYARRPDLQSRFPDPAGRDRVRFVAWATSRGFEEHALPEAFRRAVADVPGMGPSVRIP